MLDIITIIYLLEIGFMPQAIYYYDPSEYAFAYQEDVFYTELEIGLEIAGFLYVGGSVRTDTLLGGKSYPIGYPTFSPYHAEYWFLLSMYYGPFEIGFRHLCVHPVVTESVDWYLRGGRDELYFRITNKER
jgi:hypothetical protein